MNDVYAYMIVFPTEHTGRNYIDGNGYSKVTSRQNTEPVFIGTKQESREFSMYRKVSLFKIGYPTFSERFEYEWRGRVLQTLPRNFTRRK